MYLCVSCARSMSETCPRHALLSSLKMPWFGMPLFTGNMHLLFYSSGEQETASTHAIANGLLAMDLRVNAPQLIPKCILSM